MIPSNELKAHFQQCFDLDEKTGKLLWRKRTARCVKIGTEAGYVNAQGYRMVETGGVVVGAHIVVYFLHHNNWPEKQVDHINGIRDDNRPANLRQATGLQNRRNQQKPRRDSKNKYKGVYRCRNSIQARIGLDSKEIYLGSFPTEEAAALAYNKKAVELFGEFAALNLVGIV